jgi:hypothetical protein
MTQTFYAHMNKRKKKRMLTSSQKEEFQDAEVFGPRRDLELFSSWSSTIRGFGWNLQLTWLSSY